MVFSEGAWEAFEGIGIELLQVSKARIALVRQKLYGGAVNGRVRVAFVLLSQPLPERVALLVSPGDLVYAQQVDVSGGMWRQRPGLDVQSHAFYKKHQLFGAARFPIRANLVMQGGYNLARVIVFQIRRAGDGRVHGGYLVYVSNFADLHKNTDDFILAYGVSCALANLMHWIMPTCSAACAVGMGARDSFKRSGFLDFAELLNR